MSELECNSKVLKMLLVEDNPGDVLLIQKALKEGNILNHFRVAKDGEEAMRMLRREGEYAMEELPDLVLLDLNLPKKDGREVLQEIKESNELKRIPVIILTTSSAEEDILKTYNLHANCYITKPVDAEQFIKMIRVFKNFWFCIVKLPREEER